MALVAACGLVGPTPVSDQGGMGLPTKLPDERYLGTTTPFSAELTVAQDGCAYLDFGRGRMVAIWPAGSELSEPARLADGTELAPGDIVQGIGTVVEFEALPGWPDGYWGFVTGFCQGDVAEALVVDEVSEVR